MRAILILLLATVCCATEPDSGRRVVLILENKEAQIWVLKITEGTP